MALLAARHRDPESAALSIASNRASKCRKLRESADQADAEGKDCGAQLRRIADRNAESLFYDVREWIGGTVAGTNASDQTCELLHEIVARARGERES
jgi:hypothetical protein